MGNTYMDTYKQVDERRTANMTHLECVHTRRYRPAFQSRRFEVLKARGEDGILKNALSVLTGCTVLNMCEKVGR